MAFPRSLSVKQLAANLFFEDEASDAEDSVSTAESEGEVRHSAEAFWPCNDDFKFTRSFSEDSSHSTMLPSTSRVWSRQQSWDSTTDPKELPFLPCMTNFCYNPLPQELIAVNKRGVCEFVPAVESSEVEEKRAVEPVDRDFGIFAVAPNGVSYFMPYELLTEDIENEYGESDDGEDAMPADSDHGVFAVFRNGSARFVPYLFDEDESEDEIESNALGLAIQEGDFTDDDESRGFYAVGRDGVAHWHGDDDEIDTPFEMEAAREHFDRLEADRSLVLVSPEGTAYYILHCAGV
eukprot:CAMPEP_0180768046 /NCGR_PEP_ID=MMETSP1038_2-20121128/40351_1 /TAXON_ID=632150 /ORGANISM="Azadinium spinosum, Strain 3D9" /LENGTH=292 /DNA_ID=CAMNT_0022802661 /DNA_START=40 /DNA_END=914 /DNA_ORIENTATION=+